MTTIMRFSVHRATPLTDVERTLVDGILDGLNDPGTREGLTTSLSPDSVATADSALVLAGHISTPDEDAVGRSDYEYWIAGLSAINNYVPGLNWKATTYERSVASRPKRPFTPVVILCGAGIGSWLLSLMIGTGGQWRDTGATMWSYAFMVVGVVLLAAAIILAVLGWVPVVLGRTAPRNGQERWWAQEVAIGGDL